MHHVGDVLRYWRFWRLRKRRESRTQAEERKQLRVHFQGKQVISRTDGEREDCSLPCYPCDSRAKGVIFSRSKTMIHRSAALKGQQTKKKTGGSLRHIT